MKREIFWLVSFYIGFMLLLLLANHLRETPKESCYMSSNGNREDE